MKHVIAACAFILYFSVAWMAYVQGQQTLCLVLLSIPPTVLAAIAGWYVAGRILESDP